MPEGPVRPFIVPIFIPHMGCPHRCVFCRQETITNQSRSSFSISRVKDVLDRALASRKFNGGRPSEVAFFGGSFTSLPIGQIEGLLKAVSPYIGEGLFDSIRVSTRPDSLDEDRLVMMKANGVRTVELGAQSMNERVLRLSKRGHSSEQTGRAVGLLRERGFQVGIQLMPGLPGDTERVFTDTIDQVIALAPDLVRLYPAVIIRGTELARWYKDGTYRPLSLERAVELCSEACSRLEGEGIPVIRIGLMSSPSLLEEGQILGGPWHPAFGHLVRSRMYLLAIKHRLPRHGDGRSLEIHIRANEAPLLRGYRNQGLDWIRERTGVEHIELIADASVPPGDVRVERT